MTADELRAARERTDELDEVWSLFVDHEGFELPLRFECLEWTGNGYLVPDPATVEDFVLEALLTPKPVPCTVARAAGFDLLNHCASCTRH